MVERSQFTSAKNQGLKGCGFCHHVMPVAVEHCEHCGSVCYDRVPQSLQRTVAWLLTSMILFIPANTLPVMHTMTLGSISENTILEGALHMWEGGSQFIATVIILASFVVPLGKMITLFYLCASVARKSRQSLVAKTRAYQVTEFFGKWSMIDVFVVMNLVTLVQLGHIMAIQSSPGVLAFAGVVICSMLAAHSFDPRLLWDE